MLLNADITAFWDLKPDVRDTLRYLRVMRHSFSHLCDTEIVTLLDIMRSFPISGDNSLSGMAWDGMLQDIHDHAWNLIFEQRQWECIFQHGGFALWTRDFNFCWSLRHTKDRMTAWVPAAISKLPLDIKRHILSFFPGRYGITLEALRLMKKKITMAKSRSKCPICASRIRFVYRVGEFYVCKFCVSKRAYYKDYDGDYGDGDGYFRKAGVLALKYIATCYYYYNIPSVGFVKIADVTQRVRVIRN
jgi:hypothetical protein